MVTMMDAQTAVFGIFAGDYVVSGAWRNISIFILAILFPPHNRRPATWMTTHQLSSPRCSTTAVFAGPLNRTLANVIGHSRCQPGLALTNRQRSQIRARHSPPSDPSHPSTRCLSPGSLDVPNLIRPWSRAPSLFRPTISTPRLVDSVPPDHTPPARTAASCLRRARTVEEEQGALPLPLQNPLGTRFPPSFALPARHQKPKSSVVKRVRVPPAAAGPPSPFRWYELLFPGTKAVDP